MILVIGDRSQLGSEFIKLFKKLNIAHISTNSDELDITDNFCLSNFFLKNKNIDLIINCAAYNNVDKAEMDEKNCYDLNFHAVKKLTEISKKLGAILVTYSSNFVFDGQTKKPYNEKNSPNPLSVYGNSKYEAEKYVLRTLDNAFVIRTSWIFGVSNNNFVKHIINLSKKEEIISVVDDQIANPTYAKDLATFSWLLIKTRKFGLYHITNSKECSKYEQAKYILEKLEWIGSLKNIKTLNFKNNARRPLYSPLSIGKLEKVINLSIPDWKNAIDRLLLEITQISF